MKYQTTNEWNHFGFQEAYISEIQKVNGGFQFTLDNVTIEPDNSKNRDIRQMRANELYVTIQDAEIERLVEEGYKVYNANGQLMEQYEDRDIAPENYNEILKSLTDGESCIYALEKKDDVYIFTIDASSERTYVLYMKGTRDIEQWNRFLNK
ncbi:MAG: subtilin biosynthesis sensor protein SpaK [Eubacterium sp.]|nr:subtilin biosynthesis sensor protein SpaK [Eubacterium sp.]